MLFWRKWSQRNAGNSSIPRQNETESSGGPRIHGLCLPAAARTIMNAKPAVSAIIVNWNGARHLRTCLPSLLSQSYTSLVDIVVENDWRADSADVAREFQGRCLPLDSNAGLALALNRGAAMAVGDFLLFSS